MNIRLFYLLFFLCCFQSTSVAKTVVIGYLPSYYGLMKQVEHVDFTKITHLTLAFLHPNKQGVFLEDKQPTCMVGEFGKPLKSDEIVYAVNKAHQAGVKVLISFGGASYPSCAGDWQQLLLADKRAAIVNRLLHFVDEFNLDGVDIDIEGNLLTEIDNQGNFLPFVKALNNSLVAQEKLLTAATGSYIGGMLPQSTLKYFDYVSIMSYDAVGPTWGDVGVEHSTLIKAKADIQLWKKRGLTKEKLILGLPFYGYGFGQYKANYSFNDLLNEFGEKAIQADLIGKNCELCSYLTFNGYKTTKAKTELAIKQGAGVMIWELSKDHQSSKGLLNIINETVKNYQGVQ
ncbi:glycosyl hydrolase family 18 protein [Colwellia sp. 1_MG-2023]|uniref:glycosyl hydrolase family 18 protein n=1 Tax=Colwellia sp. 1_MG-2023 TaxID=3062649 RepID=UPI0026E47583|nr:glycosyl hydrolase family 18 protein [Colwellia sp. 1_MG-2023]MDO6445996.1 glycosyl hydrolase family 18 protein [Colwellia sp. 1_MG-2023]